MQETEYLRNGTTTVTSSRIEINGQTFAVRNIGSVKVDRPGRPWLAAIIAIAGLAAMIQAPNPIPGLIVAAAAGAWAWQKMRMRTLILVSGGGETVALKSTDAPHVEAVRTAIAQAISAR